MALNNVNLMGPQVGQPIDLQTQQAQLAIAQKMAEMLMQSGMSGGGQPAINTGQFVVPNYGDPLANAFNAWAGHRSLTRTQEKQAALAKELQARDTATTGDYLGARFGKETLSSDQTGGTGDPGGVGTGTVHPAIPNLIRAIQIAQSSGIPAWQAQAKKDIQDLPAPSDFLKAGQHFDPGGMQQFSTSLNPKDLAGRPQVHIEGDLATTTQDGRIVGTPQPTQTYTQGRDPVTGALLQTASGTGKQAQVSSPFGDQTPAKKTFATAGTEAAIDELKAGKDELKKAANMLPVIAQIPDLVRGAQTGIGQDWIVKARRVAVQLGIGPEDSSKIINSQTFAAAIGPSMVTALKQFGSPQSLTDTDREAAEKMSLSSLANDPNAIINAQKLIVAGTMNRALAHSAAINAAKKLPEAGNYPDFFGVEMQFGTLPDKLGISFDTSLGKFSANIVASPNQGASDDELLKRLYPKGRP